MYVFKLKSLGNNTKISLSFLCKSVLLGPTLVIMSGNCGLVSEDGYVQLLFPLP